ncbi:hypothetical protein DFH08DRAFT_1077892 [Mycena albidolilacea]|uniref:F-box domain-containing protein n=1 Tax=Mycena albidolilacea TaxID=1033008 RepID=A0AAD7EUK6_9AGAR|nr:hypothetical protein DFH08DRAFT_1077892 [Mycena albidolilacea]
MPNKTDEELFHDHEAKTRTLLAEIEKSLRDMEKQLERALQAGYDLEWRLASLEARENELVQATEPISAAQLRDVRVEYFVVQRKLRTTVEERQVLEDRRNALVRDRAALCMPITLGAFRSAPTRRVPDEILTEIFMAAKGEKVCEEWRVSVCNYPPAWASFSWALSEESPSALRWLQICLERSKAASLTVELDGTKSPRHSGLLTSALELISAHSQRLYSLRLNGDHWTSIRLTGFYAQLPRLEILQLPFLFTTHLSHQFKIAPRLHTLILPGSQPLHHISASQITSLHMGFYITPATLSHFPNMRSLTCKIVAKMDTSLWSMPHAILPNLIFWRVEFRSGQCAEPDIFDYFTTPALESLDITIPSASKIAAFLHRSGCLLRHLALRNCAVNATELVDIFEHAPNLESFTVVTGFNRTSIREQVSEVLIGRSSEALLPKLRHLVIDGSCIPLRGP